MVVAMRRLLSGAVSVGFVVAGFSAGNVIAAKGLEPLALKAATLFQGATRVHEAARLNVMFPNTDEAAKSMDLPASDDRAQLEALAGQYGKQVVSLNGIYVLQNGMPRTTTVRETRQALNDYLALSLPCLKGRHGNNFGEPFYRYDREANQAFRASLGNGECTFASLSADQQKMALDALRRNRIFSSFTGLSQWILRAGSDR